MWSIGSALAFKLEYLFLPQTIVFFSNFKKKYKKKHWKTIKNMKKKISKKNDISRSTWAEKAKWWMDQLSQIIEAKSITWSGFDLMIKRLTSIFSYHWTTRTHVKGWFIQYWYILIHSYPQRQRKNGIMACYLSLTHSQAHTHIQLPFFPFWLLRTHMVKLRSTLRNSQISKRDSSMLFMSFSWIIGPIKNMLCPRFKLVLPKL